MKSIKELVNIVKDVNLKVSDLIIPDQKTETKVNSYFYKILSDEFQSDKEAADYFYNSDVNNSSYKNLKSALRNKLVNTLLFFKSSKNKNKRADAVIYCSKYISAVKILTVLNARQTAIDFCHRILKKSLHFEFTDYTIESCFLLRSHYALHVGDSKKFEFYNDLLNHNIKTREAEVLAGELYLRILIPYTKRKSVQSDTHTQAKEAYEKLSPFLKVHHSSYLHYIAYYIESLIYVSINDYSSTVKVCTKAINYFEKKEYIYITAIKAFSHQLTLCYTQLRMYSEGKEIIEKSNTLLQPGSYNWYINLYLYLILALHSKEYQEAYYIYNRALNNKSFKKLQTRLKERWQILKAYLFFLIDSEKIQPVRDDQRFAKFRMGKFLNSVPTFSQDKRGLNIPILVIQIVLTIVHKDYSTAINRIEAIEKYRSRYLRKDENFRSNCFIKMLLQIPISGFHRAGIIRRTEKYYEQMKTVPLEIAKQANEVEIIPYENLWEIILESLSNSFYKQRK